MSVSPIRSEPPPARIAPLARLPLFFKLDGRRALVAGGSAAAAWKAELLAAAGARVDAYAPDPCAQLLALADAAPGAVAIHRRAWAPADCAGAAIAVGACNDDDEAARFAAAARAAGVPVNVIDRPAFCDFAFGAIVNRSPLVIGVSTDGAAPVFAQAIRARIETLIPHGFARWAEAAARWRPRVRGFGVRFWERFAARAAARPNAIPTEADLRALVAHASGERSAGSVALIDAGT
ncbi:MAG TPA: bifunctional precorrin-2 dehydrogenase/sirohydrochlorin ferrochelatase, partial [Xanthobacteraceae bacterium]|nr:bifunctional precorrin-2 dehydrogenase/sirohydrochlorin ferrochelatase [Xanthobacteraceae bacterium]